MSDRYRGILRDPGRGFLAGLPFSFGLHGCMVLMILVLGWLGGRDERPLLDKDIYMVSTVVLPKADGLPDKATAPPPEATPAPAVVEAEARPDEMVLNEPKEEPTPEATPEATPKPEPTPAAPEPRRPSREELLSRVDADESSTTRFAPDPDGEEGAAPTDFAAFDGARLSPYMRTLSDRIKDNWIPGSRRGKYVVGTGNIDMSLKAVVQFTINDAGAFGGPRIVHPSGDPIYDQSCLQAVIRTRRFETPPADEKRKVQVLFDPADKQR